MESLFDNSMFMVFSGHYEQVAATAVAKFARIFSLSGIGRLYLLL